MTASRPLRLAVYTDAIERGGAETSLAILLGSLGPHVDVTVVGVTAAVVNWVAAARPGAGTVLLEPVRGKRNLRPIVRHLRAIRRLRPDVLHANLRHPWSCQYGLVGGLAAPGTQVIAVEHALIPPDRPLQRTLKRLTTRRLAAHVTVGRRAAGAFEELIGMPSGSMRVIYSGARLGESKPAPRRKAELVVGCLGRFSPEKGLDVLLRALVSLDGVTAVLVGEGPERERLEGLARELGIAERVVLTGWQENPAAYVRSLDVLVSPSHSEALPLAVLEGMLAGLPVVATDVGSVSEAVEDGESGLLVAPDDVTALAAAIRRLLDDPGERTRMGERGRTIVRERFTPEAMAAAFERLYDEVRLGCAAGSTPAQAAPT